MREIVVCVKKMPQENQKNAEPPWVGSAGRIRCSIPGRQERCRASMVGSGGRIRCSIRSLTACDSDAQRHRNWYCKACYDAIG